MSFVYSPVATAAVISSLSFSKLSDTFKSLGAIGAMKSFLEATGNRLLRRVTVTI